MSEIKLVKVDNWGIYFLQRLKNFFNRTDYCDLTLQFQNKAQLKVHRLVLNACTEYFELLERTCEMYEDCLVMPDDLQADVVVPIINFMYTGHLEFTIDILDKLYQTSQILDMPVLTKLLSAHKSTVPKTNPPTYSYSPKVSSRPKPFENDETEKASTGNGSQVLPVAGKRPYNKAFVSNTSLENRKTYYKMSKTDSKKGDSVSYPSYSFNKSTNTPKKSVPVDPRPSRYELPEELDTETVFDNSFSNISYASQPLMVHPETTKQYSNRSSFSEPSTSKKFKKDVSTLEIIECKKSSESIFEDNPEDIDTSELFQTPYTSTKEVTTKDSSKLFDEILDQNKGPKLQIESSDPKLSANLDHAKIISEVLKKYPHLVKSNKNIKLKILNTSKAKKPQSKQEEKTHKIKEEVDFTYESDVIDSKQAAKLISLGAENVKGPWICLICGTPGKALHFTSYYKYRCHLVDVHKEKPVSTICEYCGLKSLKRNYMLHHLYAQHGVPPPPQYSFPKCNLCNYIALTESFLIKHKLSHTETRKFRCNVCASTFVTSRLLLAHIRSTGHKYSADRKPNLQCVYCFKIFLRETNLYAHLKTHHKQEAKEDEIIEDSDEEKSNENYMQVNKMAIKYEPSSSVKNEYELDVQYEIEEKPGGNIHIIQRSQSPIVKQKILNPGFASRRPNQIKNTVSHSPTNNESYNVNMSSTVDNTDENLFMMNNDEYILDQEYATDKHSSFDKESYVISDIIEERPDGNLASLVPNTSVAPGLTNIEQTNPRVIINKQMTLSQPIQIIVSNPEEYKALISSNQPIIFENTEADKALTVLTNAHDANLDTSLCVETPVSNSMMIINNDLPITVSDTVTTNTSNIVVVYPIDDESKEYQLVTSESQILQQSTVVSHSYETFSTCTPVVSAQVLDNPIDWQTSETVTDGQVAANISIQTQEHQIQTNSVSETVNEIHANLPEVQIPNESSDLIAVPFVIADDSLVQTNEAIIEKDIENVNLVANERANESCNDQSFTTDVRLQSDETAESATIKDTEEIDTAINNNKPEYILKDIGTNTENTNTIDDVTIETEFLTEEIVPTTQDEQTVVENEVELVQQQPVEESHLAPVELPVQEGGTGSTTPLPQETYIPCPNSPQHDTSLDEQGITESEVEASPDLSLMPDNPSVIPNNQLLSPNNPSLSPNEQSLTPSGVINDKSIHKNIQNLTSEWSDDDCETPISGDGGNDQTNGRETLEGPSTIISIDVEESIENIQQEVNNFSAMNPPTIIIEENVETQDKNVSIEMETDTSNTNEDINVSDNKISSLLNEWDDSQEEIISSNDQIENVKDVEDDDDDEKCDEDEIETGDLDESGEATVNQVNETQNLKPIDNEKIKNLVSDWDDEEEDKDTV